MSAANNKNDSKLAYFSDGIHYIRMGTGMKQYDIADSVGVKDRKMSKYENERIMPDVSIINQICDMFRLPADFFFAKDFFQDPEGTKQEFLTAQTENSDGVFNEEIYTNEMPEDFGRKK